MMYGTEREICYSCGSTIRGARCWCRYNRHAFDVVEDEPDPEERAIPDTTVCDCGQWKPAECDRCDDCDNEHGEVDDA